MLNRNNSRAANPAAFWAGSKLAANWKLVGARSAPEHVRVAVRLRTVLDLEAPRCEAGVSRRKVLL
jgi:hypothetical protein